jgi:hypothetical protein
MTKLADASTSTSSGGENSAGGGSYFADVLVLGEVRFFYSIGFNGSGLSPK